MARLNKTTDKNQRDVSTLKDEEIDVLLRELREKRYRLRVQSVTEKVEDVSQFRKTKQDIARLLTEQTARRASGAGA